MQFLHVFFYFGLYCKEFDAMFIIHGNILKLVQQVLDFISERRSYYYTGISKLYIKYICRIAKSCLYSCVSSFSLSKIADWQQQTGDKATLKCNFFVRNILVVTNRFVIFQWFWKELLTNTSKLLVLFTNQIKQCLNAERHNRTV